MADWVAIRCTVCKVRLPLVSLQDFARRLGFTAQQERAAALFREQHRPRGGSPQPLLAKPCAIEGCVMRWEDGQDPLHGEASAVELLGICRAELPGLRICGAKAESGDRCPAHIAKGGDAVETE